jgi:hypothetical protein
VASVRHLRLVQPGEVAAPVEERRPTDMLHMLLAAACCVIIPWYGLVLLWAWQRRLPGRPLLWIIGGGVLITLFISVGYT